MRDLIHPVVQKQAQAPNPHLAIIFLGLFVPNYSLTLLSKGLLFWPAFSALTATHYVAYQNVFFTLQLLLVAGSVFWFSRNYPSALWRPQPPWGRSTALALVILTPLLLYHLATSLKAVGAFMELLRLGNRRAVMMVHERVWDGLAYGASGSGVILSSVASFVAPPLEELIFSGLILNFGLRRFHPIAAILGTPCCFALVHAVPFGFGLHLLPLFFAGLTYTCIRAFSGSLGLAIAGHCLVNAVIFFPRWIVAIGWSRLL